MQLRVRVLLVGILTAFFSFLSVWAKSQTGGSYLWNGSAGSDWHNGVNWTKAAGLPAIPTASDDVIILAGSSVVISAPAYCKSIIFQSVSNKGMSNLAANAGLTVSGKMTVGLNGSGAHTSTTISGSVSCDSLIMESLSANNSLTVEGRLTVLSSVKLARPRGNYNYTFTNTLKVNGEMNVGGNVVSDGDFGHSLTEVLFGSRATLLISGDYNTPKSSAKTNMSSGGTLMIGRDWKSENNPALSPGFGTVVYNGNGSQVVKPIIYYNLTLAGSGTKTISNVTVYGKFSLQGTALASAVPGYQPSAVLEYKGSVPQITGAELPSMLLIEVIIDNPYGVILNESKTIKTLSLVNGVVKTNGFTLTLGLKTSSGVYAGGVNGGTPSAYVEGKLSRVYANSDYFNFPIGKNGNYRPIAIKLVKNPGIAGESIISAEQFEAPLAATLPPNTSLYSDRHWSITQSGLNPGTFAYDISLDGTGFSSSGKPLVFKYDGSSVLSQEAEVVGNVFTVTNLNTFSSFALGESSIATSIIAESPAAIKYGDHNVTLTATVMRENGTTPVTSGTVEFFLDNTSVGVCQTIINGKASVSYDPSNLGAGSYLIKAVYRGDGTLTGSSSDPGGNGVLIVNKAPVTITFKDIEQTYDGSSKAVIAQTYPEGVSGVAVKYFKGAGSDRIEVVPDYVINAGPYDIEATLVNDNYELPGSDGRVTGVFSIRKAAAVLAFDSATLNLEYTGLALSAKAIANWNGALMEGVTVQYTREGVAEISPIQAGTYQATATLIHENIEAAPVTADFVIRKAPTLTTVHVSDATYDGSTKGSTASVTGIGSLNKSLAVSYTGATAGGKEYISTDPPSDAGSYLATATYAGDDNHLGSKDEKSFAIAPAPAIIRINDLETIYNGHQQEVAVTTEPAGVPLSVTYNGSSLLPSEAGTYNVLATVSNSNYLKVSAMGTLVINKADQVISWANPDDITFGTALGGIQLNAQVIGLTGGSAIGAVAYNPTLGTVLGAGDAQPLTLEVAETGNYKAASKTVYINVAKATPVVAVTVRGGTYNGTAFTATVTAVGVRGEDLVKELTISYEKKTGADTWISISDAPVDAGDYRAIASYATTTNYHGASDSKEFTIAKASSSTTVTLNGGPFTYTGSPITPATVRVTGAGGLSLTREVTYSNNLHAGIATASYSYPGDENHEPSDDIKSFVIGKARPVVTAMPALDLVYSGMAKSGSGKVTGVGGSADELLPAVTLSYVGAGSTIYPASEVAPTNAGTYMIQASFAGNNDYEAGMSSEEPFVITKAIPEVKASGGGFMYDGSPKPGGGTASGVGVPAEDLSSTVSITYTGVTDGGATYGPSTAAPTLAGRYTITAACAETTNYLGRSSTADLLIYAIPVVTLSTPSPIAINNTATVTVDIKGVVQPNRVWKYTNVLTGVTIVSQTDDKIDIKSSVPVVYAVSLEYKNAVGQPNVTPATYAVFYDPAAGFVSGGGWIASSEIQELPYMQVAGKAHFGFVSKYEKGKSYPTGNTEFQFQAGGLNFKSSVYEWLVIAGNRAQYKGWGTVNGTGNYGFMLTALDGNMVNAVGADLFRIKIWDKNNGDAIVYDNQYKSADDAELTTSLGGGSVVIHVPAVKKSATALAADARRAEESEFASFNVKVFPNPTQGFFAVHIESGQVTDQYSLRVLDLYGRTIEVINKAASGQTYRIGAAYRPGIYFVEVVQGTQRKQIQLLKMVY